MHHSQLHAKAALVVHRERVDRHLAAHALRASRTAPSGAGIRIGRRVRVEVWLPLPARRAS